MLWYATSMFSTLADTETERPFQGFGGVEKHHFGVGWVLHQPATAAAMRQQQQQAVAAPQQLLPTA
jgi:hypothetical protein